MPHYVNIANNNIGFLAYKNVDFKNPYSFNRPVDKKDIAHQIPLGHKPPFARVNGIQAVIAQNVIVARIIQLQHFPGAVRQLRQFQLGI